MLYTVKPLETIYSNTVQSLIISRYGDRDISEGITCMDIEHGKVYARKEGENYIIDRIHSTNLSDYLDEKYHPGSIIKHSSM